ncbi:DNA topoisomerase IV [Robiginitalea aurantiaca]|uniref:DNA topoisomerase IV n=1 Tax=Robiginitalea aurantiaca TaxID=3056915 RepID=A0ABT7WFW6_9FLAO|nr:DNA topoisomerase IV [Robiginitalea aurantiaca]MDM9631817.1 DNA topoisomerase IV [Robiginitalea aurantiaca]
MKAFLPLLLIVLISSCQEPARDCEQFHTGTFRFTAMVGDTEETTLFTRTGDLEISQFKGMTDSASVRWINPCEYIVTNLNPDSREDEKSIHMKILSTTDTSYTFEYKLVGSPQGSRGTAYKTD